MLNRKILQFALLTLTMLGTVANADGWGHYNTFEPNNNYFEAENHMPEYYRPRTMNPMIAMLPEYSFRGPGYICDTRQAPPVYRMPLQYHRNVGYREADWFNNRLNDRHMHPMNFGGYDY